MQTLYYKTHLYDGSLPWLPQNAKPVAHAYMLLFHMGTKSRGTRREEKQTKKKGRSEAEMEGMVLIQLLLVSS